MRGGGRIGGERRGLPDGLLLEHDRRRAALVLLQQSGMQLAEAHARAGRIERALELSDQAVAEVGRTGERWWEAEAQRSRGEILLQVGPGKRDEAERCFKKALACARRQEAMFWELHAAESLARLWQAQGRGEQARELLTSVHGQIAMVSVSRI